MKTILILIIFLLVVSGAFFWFYFNKDGNSLLNPFAGGFEEAKSKPLLAYSFPNLEKRRFEGSQIVLEKVIKKEEKFTSYVFSFKTDKKKVTGQANFPKGKGSFPVIIMVRGYADDKIYFTGLGTRKAAGKLAENGFLTLAPDFLGFAGSDTSSADILEARFEKPITVLNLLASVKSLKQADPDKVGLWGHSNGGQIAVSVLEISKKPYPTVLWAPVTTGFPQNILQYMSELDDQGLKVKSALDNFVNLYDEKEFSIDNYFGHLTASFQLHQGLSDALVDEESTNKFYEKMKAQGIEITYYKYSRNDHNLSRDWDLVMSRDLEFFGRKLK